MQKAKKILTLLWISVIFLIPLAPVTTSSAEEDISLSQSLTQSLSAYPAMEVALQELDQFRQSQIFQEAALGKHPITQEDFESQVSFVVDASNQEIQLASGQEGEILVYDYMDSDPKTGEEAHAYLIFQFQDRQLEAIGLMPGQEVSISESNPSGLEAGAALSDLTTLNQAPQFLYYRMPSVDLYKIAYPVSDKHSYIFYNFLEGQMIESEAVASDELNQAFTQGDYGKVMQVFDSYFVDPAS